MKKDHIIFLVIAICLIIDYPYIINCFMHIKMPVLLTYIGSIGVLMAMSSYYKNKYVSFNPLVPIVITIQLVGMTVLYLAHNYDSADIMRIAIAVITFVTIYFVRSTISLEKYVKWHNYVIILQVIMGTIAFFAVYFGVLSPIFSFINPDGRTAYFFGLTCTNSYLGNIIRYSGFFDEPGQIAFWGVYSLILNKLFVKNKMVEFSLIIGLLFTFSMAYYVQLIMYILAFYVLNRRNNVSKFSIPIMIIIGLAFLYVSSNRNSDLYDITLGRVSIGQGIEFQTQRYDLAELAKRKFESNPIFGVGTTEIKRGEYMSDNQYEILASDGIFGFIILYLPLIALFFKKHREKSYYGALLILMAGYFQRPIHTYFIQYLMIYIFFVMMSDYENKKLASNRTVYPN